MILTCRIRRARYRDDLLPGDSAKSPAVPPLRLGLVAAGPSQRGRPHLRRRSDEIEAAAAANSVRACEHETIKVPRVSTAIRALHSSW